MDTPVEQLTRALAALRSTLSVFRLSREHLVPDMALLGFLNEVEEHGEIVLHIGAHRFCDRAYPAARAVFESSQRAVVLAMQPDYDIAGARAWVYYLRRERDFALDVGGPGYVREDGMTPDSWYAAALDEIADVWDSVSKGKGQIIHKAAALVARRSKPDNFLGVNVAPEIRDRFAAVYQRAGLTTSIDVARIQNNAYAAASLQAHPQTRLRPSNLAEHEDGSIVITFEERDRPHQYNGAVTLAAGAIGLADMAARLRLSGATRPPAPTPEG